jgi:hypothetical protein
MPGSEKRVIIKVYFGTKTQLVLALKEKRNYLTFRNFLQMIKIEIKEVRNKDITVTDYHYMIRNQEDDLYSEYNPYDTESHDFRIKNNAEIRVFKRNRMFPQDEYERDQSPADREDYFHYRT